MRISFLALASLTLAGLGPAAFAQSTGSGFSEQTPAENVQSGAVQSRAPGQVVKLAIAQHRERSNARLAAQRAGDTSVLAPELPTLLGGGSNSLTDLLGGLLGGLTGLGDIGALLDGLGGGAAGTDDGTGSTGSTPATSNGASNLTPEAIALLEANGFNVNDLLAQSRQPASTSTAVESDKAAVQQTTEIQPEFAVRWADAMLSTLFTALTIGFQTPDFVDFLVDILTPSDDTTGDAGNNASGNDADAADGTPVNVDRDPNSIVLRHFADSQGLASFA